MSTRVEQSNAAALRLRESFATLRLDRFVPATELRRNAPFHGYVDVGITGVPTFAMLSNNDDFVAERYFWLGPDAYEPMSLRIWSALARKSPVVLDVGAYTGVYALAAATANRKAKVYAFEALDRVYHRLLLNKEVNGLGNLQVVPVAVAHEPGEVELKVYAGESVLVTGSSVIGANTREVAQTKRVRADSLDSLLAFDASSPRVGLLKIDTEGAEHLVLRGASSILDRCRPDIICELLPGAQIAEVSAGLRARGYRFVRIDEREMRLVATEQLGTATGQHDLNTLFTVKTDAELERTLGEVAG